MADKVKKHRFKSMDGALRKIERQNQYIESLRAFVGNLKMESAMLAKLAADGPTFNNPISVLEAKKVRDRILRTMGLNPDGTFVKEQS